MIKRFFDMCPPHLFTILWLPMLGIFGAIVFSYFCDKRFLIKAIGSIILSIIITVLMLLAIMGEV